MYPVAMSQSAYLGNPGREKGRNALGSRATEGAEGQHAVRNLAGMGKLSILDQEITAGRGSGVNSGVKK